MVITRQVKEEGVVGMPTSEIKPGTAEMDQPYVPNPGQG